MKGLALLPSLWAHAQMGDDDDDADYEYDADDDTRTRFARSGPRSLEASQARGVVLVLELESELVPLLVQIQVLVRVRFCPEGKGKARPPFGTTVQLCKRSRPHSATTVLHSRRARLPSRRAGPPVATTVQQFISINSSTKSSTGGFLPGGVSREDCRSAGTRKGRSLPLPFEESRMLFFGARQISRAK